MLHISGDGILFCLYLYKASHGSSGLVNSIGVLKSISIVIRGLTAPARPLTLFHPNIIYLFIDLFIN